LPDQRRIVWWIVGGLAVLLVFGNRGFRGLADNIREKRRLERSLVRLREDHVRLTQELGWIQKDPAYSEYLVRKNLGYVKKGEVEYRFLKKGNQGSAGK
jgi:cell division protein FtsB